MKACFRVVFFSAMCLMLAFSCQRHRLLKQAIKTEQQGQSDKALQLYFDLCNAYSNTAACESFQRLVEVKVDSLVMAARTSAGSGNCDQASLVFSETEDFIRAYPGHLIDLNHFHSARSSTMERCYGGLLAEGERSLMNGQFEQAMTWCSKIPVSYTGYERAQQIHQLARLSVLYELAEKFFHREAWSDAYSAYSAIRDDDKNFRDVKTKMEECLRHLIISMAYVSVPSNVGDQNLNRRTELLVREALKSLMGERIRILERTDLEVLLEQQRLQMQATFDDETGASLGLLERASFYLTAEWMGLDFFETPSRRESCSCSSVYGIPDDCAECFRTYTSLAAKAELKIQVLVAGTGEAIITHRLTSDQSAIGLRHEFVLNSKGEKWRSSGKMSVIQDPGDIPLLTRNQLQEQLIQQLAAQVSERVYHVFED